jgi:hypothetical protein
MRAITSGETPIVAALAADFGADQSAEIPLVDRDGIEVNASPLQADEFTDSKPRPHSRVSGSVFSSELILTAKSSRTEYQVVGYFELVGVKPILPNCSPR